MTALLVDSFRFGAPAFNPLTQVTALHAGWAGDPSWSTGKPADGGTVTAWRNQSGAGDLTNVSGTPTYRTSAASLGSKPAIEFDGVDDALGLDVSDQAQSYKVIVVGRWLALPGANSTIFGSGQGSGSLLRLNSNNRLQAIISSTNPIGMTAGTYDTAGHVIRVTVNGASSEIWDNGSSLATGTLNGTSLAWVKIGCNGSTTSHVTFGNVQVGFYGVYDGATSDVDLAALAADLKTHYSL